MFTEEINKIVFSSSYNNSIKSIDSVETYAYRTRKYSICKKRKKINVTI